MFTDFAIFFKGRAVRKAISRKAIADFTHASDDADRTEPLGWQTKTRTDSEKIRRLEKKTLRLSGKEAGTPTRFHH